MWLRFSACGGGEKGAPLFPGCQQSSFTPAPRCTGLASELQGRRQERINALAAEGFSAAPTFRWGD